MSDPTARDLIQRLVDAIDSGFPAERIRLSHLMAEARAYLAAPDEPAAPDGREPTDEELEKLADNSMAMDGATGGMFLSHLEYACAVLARWGSR